MKWWVLVPVAVLVSMSRPAAASAPGERQRIAILPVASVAASREVRDRLGERMSSWALQMGDDAPLAVQETDDALVEICGDRSRLWECYDDHAALMALGRRLNATAVVTGRLGVLGDVMVLRLQVLQVRDGGVYERTIELDRGANANLPQISLSLPSSALAQTGLPQTPAKPIRSPPQTDPRTRTWIIVSATLGAAAVVAVAGLVWAATRDGDHDVAWTHRASLP